jgi:hypothetical protein
MGACNPPHPQLAVGGRRTKTALVSAIPFTYPAQDGPIVYHTTRPDVILQVIVDYSPKMRCFGTRRSNAPEPGAVVRTSDHNIPLDATDPNGDQPHNENDLTGLLKADMVVKGYSLVVEKDLMPSPGQINADTMRREGRAGTVSLPPTIYSAPIVLTLTAEPNQRGNRFDYLLMIGPVWLAVALSAFLQLAFSYFMLSAMVDTIVSEDGEVAVISDGLVPECGEGTTDPLLRVVAHVTFAALVLADMIETYEMHIWLSTLPGSKSPEKMCLLRFTEKEPPAGGKNTVVVPVSGICFADRLAFYLFSVVLKFVVAFACLIAGTGAVLRSADDFGLVLNAVAATFILQIDDAIYLLLVDEESRKMTAAMPAITKRVTAADGGTCERDEKTRSRQRRRPLNICILVGLLFAITYHYWCTGDLVSEVTFGSILFGIAGVCTAWSCSRISKVKTVRKKLVVDYVEIMKKKCHYELSDDTLAASGAEVVCDALTKSPQLETLKIIGVPEAAKLALSRRLAKELSAGNRMITSIEYATPPPPTPSSMSSLMTFV